MQRLTVYRYFPDEESLYQACTAHWLKLNPPPDLAEWAEIKKADKRSYAALLAFCQSSRQTEMMWSGAYRDVDDIEALQKPMAGYEAYLDLVRDDLLTSWKVTGKRKQHLSLTIRHCLRFTTWQSL